MPPTKLKEKTREKIKASNLSAKDFPSALKKKPPVIYLIYNESDSETADFIEIFKSELSIKDDNIFLYLGPEMDLNVFITDYCNVPLFGEKRLFVIKNLNDSKQKRDSKLIAAFIKLISDPQPENYILLTNPYISEKNSSEFIYKTMINSSVIRIKEGNAIEWIKEYAEKNGKTIDIQAAKKLFALSNEKKNIAKAELDKLFLYSLDEKEITITAINKAVQNYDEDNIFNLIDNIMLNQYEKSVLQFRDLLNKKIPLAVILFNIIDKFNKLVYFSETASKMKYIGDAQLEQICAILIQKYKVKINFYEKFKFKTMFQKYDLIKLKTFLKYLIELDAYQKSRDGFFNETVFEIFLRKLAD
ncbi:MAG TPA: DNA polymerase III subunit delta [bacterium]|nr:DNA polymerase III subunit delta [bacterium]HPN31255.1 DNA polymerase III subunit delta [bacterium]